MAANLGTSVGLDTAQLEGGVEKAKRLARSMSEGMAAAWAKAAIGAENAAKASTLFAREQGQQARTVNRLTAELTAMGVVTGKGAALTAAFGQVALEASTGGLASLGGAVAALGAAYALNAALTAKSQEQIARLDKEQAERSQQVAKEADAARRALILRRSQGQFSTPKEAEAALDLADRIGRASTAAGVAQGEFERARDRLQQMKEQSLSLRLAAYFTNAKDEVEKLNTAMVEAKGNLKALEDQAAAERKWNIDRFKVVSSDSPDYAGTKLDKYGGYGKGTTSGITPSEVELADRVAKERAEAAKRDAEKRRLRGLDRVRGYGSDLGTRGRYASGDEIAAEDAQDAGFRSYQGRGGYTSSFDVGQGAAYSQQLASREAEQHKKATKAAQAHAKIVEDLKQDYRDLALRAGEALGQVIAKQRDGSQALKEITAEAIRIAGEAAIKMILNNSWVAGSKTAAETPGPWALAAGAAMQVAVAAMAGAIQSAYGGADWAGKRGTLDSRGGFLSINHPGEGTMPESIMRPMKKAIANGTFGGGDGGVVMNFNGPGWDAAGIRKLVVNRQFTRALREGARRGAI